jgi:hypothetical protein
MNALEPIAIDESKRLISLEATIAAGRQSFLEVGSALAEIRDSRLYRAEFDSFQSYCRAKWGWDKSYCHRLICAADTAKASPNGTITNEAQARALAAVPESSRAATIERAQATGKLTAQSIRAAAKSPSGSANPQSHETHSPESAGSGAGDFSTPPTEPERIFRPPEDDPPHIRTATEEMAEEPERVCDWTPKDFADELAGLSDKAAHFIVTSSATLDCALALEVLHKNWLRRYESMKAKGL